MEVRIIEEKEDSIKLSLKDVPLSLSNAIRRMILTRVPVMCVDEVLIIENSSVLPNEVLAYRISLIPFVTDLENYVLPEECDCGSKVGCNKCAVRFSLKAEATNGVLTVYSRDMVPEAPSTAVRPVSGDFPIVKLAPGQRIEMELYVRLGTGAKHSKWQPGIATLYEVDGDSRVLYFESFGFLPPRRVVLEALNRLIGGVASFKAKFEETVVEGAANETSAGEVQGA